MAKAVCDIHPRPRFYEDAGEAWSVLNSVLDPNRGPNIKARQGYDRRFLQWSAAQLEVMAPMDMEQILNYVVSQGWLKQKELPSGKTIYLIKNSIPADELGEMAAVLNDVVLGGARATKSLADEFVLKVEGGQNPTAEGIALARSLRAISNLGEVIMGLDQQAGRSMRARMLQKRRMQSVKDKKFLTRDGQELSAESMEAAQMNTNVMDSIARNLQDPANRKQAIDDLMEIAERIKFVHDPMAIARAGLGLNYTGDMWREVFMNGLLSSPDTLTANASGIIWAPMRAYAQGLGAKVLQPVFNQLDDGAGDRLWMQSVQKIAAVNQSFRDAFQIGWQGYKQNRFMYAEPEGAMARSITGTNVEQALGRELPDSYKDVIDQIGRIVNLPSRGLKATDEIARHIALRGEVAERAVRVAQVEGVDLGSKEAMDAAIQKEFDKAFKLDPLSDSKWFYSNAYDVASSLDPGGKAISNKVRESTFQEYNGAATALQNAVPAALKPFFPFIRTPLNIIRQGVMENTVIGPLFNVAKTSAANIRTPTKIIVELQKQMLADPAQTARITGQISFMTAMGAFWYQQAMAGNITGGGPRRFIGGAQGRRAQQAWLRNNVPYSFRVGKTAFPITRIPEPMATLLRIYGDMGQASAYFTQAERDHAFAAVAFVGATGLYQSSMLDGIEKLVSIFSDDSQVDRKIGAAFQQYAATQAPFSGLLAYVDRAVDPYKSAYQAPSFVEFFTNWGDLFTTGVLGKAADRFPGGSMGRPIQIDQIGGEPVPISPGVGPTGLNPLLSGVPLFPRNIPVDDAWQAVYDIGMGWKDYEPAGYEITLAEQMRLNERMGRIRLNGKTLRQAILDFRRRPDVEQYVQQRGAAVEGRAAQIERELNEIKNAYGEAAIEEMAAGNVSIIQRSAVYDQIQEAKRTNNINKARQLQTQLERLMERAERGY